MLKFALNFGTLEVEDFENCVFYVIFVVDYS